MVTTLRTSHVILADSVFGVKLVGVFCFGDSAFATLLAPLATVAEPLLSRFHHDALDLTAGGYGVGHSSSTAGATALAFMAFSFGVGFAS